MRKLYLSIAAHVFFAFSVSAQCPRIAGIMVDACGLENNNEFIFLLNGNAALNVDDLVITFPANGSISVANTNDFSANSGTSPTGACLTLLDDGGVIPANAPVVIFMSNNIGQAYDLTSWCTQYGTVYILYRNLAAPTTPTFLNTNPTAVQRTVALSVNLVPACAANFTYNVPVTSVDGNFYRFPAPTAGTSLSPGSVNNGCASPPPVLLPVTLTAFTVGIINQAAVLRWTTTTEINSSHFEIERSADGEHFSVVGRLAAAGQSNTPLSYQYTDPGAVNGRTWYRLRTVDLDGQSAYSRIIRLQATASGVALHQLYPNPVSDELVIEWNGRLQSKAALTVVDLQGRILQTNQLTSVAGFNQGRLFVGSLRAGTYFLKLDVDGEQFSERFVKK